MWNPGRGTKKAMLLSVIPVGLVLVLARDQQAGPKAVGKTSESTARAVQDAAARPPGVDSDWLSSVLEDIEGMEYEVTATSSGQQAPNRAQDFRTHFREAGIEVVPLRGDVRIWRFAWRTSGFGRKNHLQSVTPVAPVIDGFWVRYPREAFTEWYENTRNGVEQGFTIHRRPAGDGKLRIEGRIGDSLDAKLDVESGAVDFYATEEGAHVLRYDKLRVWDAADRDLPARLALEGDQLAIVVDDERATYPITIDPLLSTPDWTIVEQADSEYGTSVATAGDVNGDGFSDVLVGAPAYDAGQTGEGRAFLYLGSAAGLQTAPAWTFDGDQLDAACGSLVATAGDINGDGFSDIIIGAHSYDDGDSTDAGRASVFHGSATGPAQSPDWTAYGAHQGALFGFAVGTAGDVNGDGFSDVLVTAPDYDGGQAGEGRAYQYLGSSSGLETSPAWTAESNQTNARFGYSAGTAGDVNADGFADVIVGCYQCDDGSQVDEGQAFVYHGSAAGLSALPNWTAESDQAQSLFGLSVGGAGDVDGDGYSDIVVGAPLFDIDSGQTNAGRMYVYRGAPGGLTTTAAYTDDGAENQTLGWAVATAGDLDGDGRAEVVAGAPHLIFMGVGTAYVYKWLEGSGSMSRGFVPGPIEPGGHFGAAVGTAGDVDGDGYAEVIVGMRNADRASVYRGLGGTLAAAPVATLGGYSGRFYGRSVASAGDVNGDGYADVIVGAPRLGGAAFVYHGSATGQIPPSAAWSAWDVAPAFGKSVSSAGDVNGDGFSDVIVGSSRMAFVYHGSAAGLEESPAWQDEDESEFDYSYDWKVATAGDVNGDGFSDVIIGAPFRQSSNDGTVFVYHGSPTGLGAPVWSVQGKSEALGFAVGTAGDVNGDGYSDVIFGNGYSAAYVYHGSESGLGPSPDWVGEFEQSLFGEAVGTAGDVNGDGFSDVVVGAPGAESGEQNEGMAFLYLGSASGLDAVAAWVCEGNQPNARFGSSVGYAGDVNRDGFSDVIVGASRYDNGESREGRAFLYHGSGAGLSAASAWIAEAPATEINFGHSVGTAGDFTGDGFADVIVGAPEGYGQNDPGYAFLYLGNDGGGLHRLPRQLRHLENVPIDLLGRSDSPSAFVVEGLGRSAAGRSRVRLEVEVKPLGLPFDGTGVLVTPELDTGDPAVQNGVELSQVVSGLSADTPYRWRLRFVTDSPFFPWSPWFSMAGNGVTETDLRTAPSPTAVESGESRGAGLRLALPRPNPFQSLTKVAFTLEHAGRARLAVYDVRGRMVASLADGPRAPGRYTAEWNGRASGGTPAAAGIYYLRLETSSGAETRKLVFVR